MSSLVASFATRRNAIVLAALVFAGLFTLAVYNRPGFPGGTQQNGAPSPLNTTVGQTLKTAGDTVAGLFDLRSPGNRIAGLLALNKHRPQLVRHERALPKVRKTSAAPLAGIVGSPPASGVPPTPPADNAPLYNAITSAPPIGTLPEGGVGGGPGGFPAISFPGGGGGGVIIPPVVTTTPPTTPSTPTTPTPPTPAVPEPGSWAMMLIGFLLIGQVLRSHRPIALVA